MPRKPTKRNLVYLTFEGIPCYLHVSGRKPKDVELNLKEGTWEWKGLTQKIGEERYIHTIPDSGNSTIGVYDGRNTNHLNQMVTAAVNLAKRHN